MCGIVGYHSSGTAPMTLEELTAFREILSHRGPDGKGQWVSSDGRVALAHRRLAVLDTSEAGLQPMLSSSGNAVITYNGEIFNYREVREDLKREGFSFRTGTDTEVILAAYEHWGEECVTRFNGMWSFALWDQRALKLFCSRDRLGIKPFYYFAKQAFLLFASEIKALLSTGRVPRLANPAAVYDYINFSRKDHTTDTFVDGVKCLPAGHNLIVWPDGRLELRRFWTLNSNRSTGRISSRLRVEASNHLLELLSDAIRLHFRADVPTGICLSGGLDSSTIAIIAADLLRAGKLDPAAVRDHLRCYTSHFPGETIDETPFAHEVVRATGAGAAWVIPSGDRMFEHIDDLVYHLDEPFVSSSMFAQWTVIERAAQDGVKVLLDGQGGDEVFGGYPIYAGVYLLHLLGEGRFFSALKEGHLMSAGLNPHPWRTAVAELARLLYAVLPGPARSLARGRVRAVGRFLQPVFSAAQAERDAFIASRPRRTNLQDRLFDDTTCTNLPALLRYEDRISMAFGIEARVPLLDYRIVEYAFSLPASAKICNGWSKYILREAMRGALPEIVRLRRDKLGFPTPQTRWLASRLDWIRSLFSEPEFRAVSYLQGTKIAKHLPALLQSDAGGREVWRWLCLELWMRRFSMTAGAVAS